MGDGGIDIEALLKFSDPFLVTVTVILAWALKPWLQGPDGEPPRNARERLFEGDRIILAVLFLGTMIGCGAEAVSPEFDAHMAFRRVLATAGGASLAFKLWRTFGPKGTGK